MSNITVTDKAGNIITTLKADTYAACERVAAARQSLSEATYKRDKARTIASFERHERAVARAVQENAQAVDALSVLAARDGLTILDAQIVRHQMIEAAYQAERKASKQAESDKRQAYIESLRAQANRGRVR